MGGRRAATEGQGSALSLWRKVRRQAGASLGRPGDGGDGLPPQDWGRLGRAACRVARTGAQGTTDEPGRVRLHGRARRGRFTGPSGKTMPTAPEIWQERHTPKGWKPGLRDTRRVLYRLPDVIEQARAGGIVFLVEGEKVADSLEWLGLVATSSPMGAGKWTDDYAVFRWARRWCCARTVTSRAAATCTAPAARSSRPGARPGAIGARCAPAGRPRPPRPPRRAEGAHSASGRRHPGRAPPARARARRELPGADPETLYAFREEAAYHASPGDRELRHCPRCERARPHLMRAGVAYCPCGALAVPRHDTPS